MRLVWVLIAALLMGCASTGGSGGAVSAEDAALLPEIFPLYPGAQLTDVREHATPQPASAAQSAQGDASQAAAPAEPLSVSATLETDDSPEQVVEAYTALLRSKGWRPKLRSTPGEQAIVARRGKRTALLMVRGDDSGSTIDVLLVKKPKRRGGKKRRARPAASPPS